MTNRIPLIVDAGAGQIQELSASDNLSLGNSSVVNANVVSATYLVGDGSNITNIPAGNYSNANVEFFLAAGLVSNIIPDGNAVYSLGNVTNQWKDLYVSNSTIYIGNVPISIGAGNTLTVAGQPILSNDSNTTINTTGDIVAGNIGITGDNLTWANASIVQTSASDLSITGDGQVTVRSLDGTYQWTFDSNGNLTAPSNINTSANVTANYFLGDGSQLTNLPVGNYSNANVANYLPTYTGNVTANYFLGDGSQLTNLPAGDYSNANVANYLPTYTGNIASLTGNVTTTANISGSFILGNGRQLTSLPNNEVVLQAEYHVSPSGSDTTGVGTQSHPYQTITHVLNLGIPSSSKIILHAGGYNENVTINTTNLVIVSAQSDTYGSPIIYGKVTIADTPLGNVVTSVHLAGISLENLEITSSGTVYLEQSNILYNISRSGIGYTEINNCDLQLRGAANTASFTGTNELDPLITVFKNSTVNNLQVNANTYVSTLYCDSVANVQVNSGSFAGVCSTIVSDVPGNYALTVSNSGYALLSNGFVYDELILGAPGAINTQGGTYTISNMVYNQVGSLLGTSVDIINYFTTLVAQTINTTGNITATGNISGSYILGDGSQLTNLPDGNYSNANVANYLPTYTGNLVSLTGNVTTTANISGNYVLGNGALLTGISSSTYGNSNVTTLLAALGANVISGTANITTTANVNGANVTATGIVRATGNVQGGNLITTSGVVRSQAAAVDMFTNSACVTIGGTSRLNLGVPSGTTTAVTPGLLETYGNLNLGFNLLTGNSSNINGDASQFHITGGANGQILITDGAGNLTWANTGGGGTYGNADVAAYLPTYTGNLVGLTGNVNTTANVNASGVTATGNIRGGNVTGGVIYTTTGLMRSQTGGADLFTNSACVTLGGSTRLNLGVESGTTVAAVPGILETYGNLNLGFNLLTGNSSNINGDASQFHITGGANGQILITDGAGNLTWANTGGGGTYGNADVVANLAALGSNPIDSTANIITTANISGSFLLGNGAFLTGISGGSTYGNANVVANLAALGSNPIDSTANIITTANISGSFLLGNGAFLTGISGGNISTAGNVSITAGASTWVFDNTGNTTFPNSFLLRTNSNNALSLGRNAGSSGSPAQANAIAIGSNAGGTNQGASAIAIGTGSGATSQTTFAIAIGAPAGGISQGQGAIAIGAGSGATSQTANAVAIGRDAGSSNQGARAIAIGDSAGRGTQGANAIAIGHQAGRGGQAARTIILNASGANVSGTPGFTDALYIAPIRQDTTTGNIATDANVLLYYNTVNKEVFGSTDLVFDGLNLEAGNLFIDTITFSGYSRVFGNTVANLATPTSTSFATAFVTDATSRAFGTLAVGGGTNCVPVYYDGLGSGNIANIGWYIG